MHGTINIKDTFVVSMFPGTETGCLWATFWVTLSVPSPTVQAVRLLDPWWRDRQVVPKRRFVITSVAAWNPIRAKISFTMQRKPEVTHSFKFTSHDSVTLYSDLLTRVRHVTEQHCTSFHNSVAFPQDTCFTGNRAVCSRWTKVTSVSTHR